MTDIRTAGNPDDVVFVRITNAQIYSELQDLKQKVTALNIKFYGIATGLLAAIALLLKQGNVL